MEVGDALRARRMVRDFDGTEVDEGLLVEVCVEALRAPTAGHARGVEAVVLGGSAGVARYLGVATDAGWRQRSPLAAGLARAGGVVLIVCEPDAYARRYAEPDKAASGLDSVGSWPVPYWFGDAGAATMALLVLAIDRGLSASFVGAFRHERDVLEAVGAPTSRRLYGAVFLGHAAGPPPRSASLRRDGPTRAERVLRGGYERPAR